MVSGPAKEKVIHARKGLVMNNSSERTVVPMTCANSPRSFPRVFGPGRFPIAHDRRHRACKVLRRRPASALAPRSVDLRAEAMAHGPGGALPNGQKPTLQTKPHAPTPSL